MKKDDSTVWIEVNDAKSGDMSNKLPINENCNITSPQATAPNDITKKLSTDSLLDTGSSKSNRVLNSASIANENGESSSLPTFRQRQGSNEADGQHHVHFSEKSRNVIETANRLLDSIDSSPRQIDKYSITDNAGNIRNRYSLKSDANNKFLKKSPDRYLSASTAITPSQLPRFPRVNFDENIEEELADRKPAWQQLQENIKNSYRKPKRSVERHRELNEMRDATLNYAMERRRSRRSQSPFSLHLNGESFLPRAQSWMANGAIQPRNLEGTGPYCAPALDNTAGLESDSQVCRPFSRYERLVNDIESRLLKTSLLPAHIKTVTTHEFRRAPQPSSGSSAEEFMMDEELGIPLPRPYYSRPDRSDPNYFDFDLQHSIDLYRKPDGVYIPRGPQPWENKVLRDAMFKADVPVSSYIFTGGEPIASTSSGSTLTTNSIRNTFTDWRTTGTSYLSAALRTASFWEHRFMSIGAQVRDSNPVSMESILRNKPIPNRFTEYRDPDFEDYEDPHELD